MFLFTYANDKWSVLCEWRVREDSPIEDTYVSAVSGSQVMVRTLDFEAMLHDTLISIKNPYRQHHYFDID